MSENHDPKVQFSKALKEPNRAKCLERNQFSLESYTHTVIWVGPEASQPEQGFNLKTGILSHTTQFVTWLLRLIGYLNF